VSFDLTGTGVWSGLLRHGDAGEAAEAAAELEELGWSALWVPDVGGDVFGALRNLLSATSSVVVATGILNIWMHPAEETAAEHARLTAEHGDRLLVGLGVSHQHLIDRMNEPGTYRQPLGQMVSYLDALDGADPSLPADRRALAALGPKMLQLARERTAGTHPYLVTPLHTQRAREALGPDGLVAPEQGVVLDTDPAAARAIARQHLTRYMEAPNYVNNWRRLGMLDEDLADGGSDRLVDALVAWGDESAIAARVQEHRDAGADHVCVQVLTDQPTVLPRREWRALAPALT
jgi:probable F420-dependent oxidoreductase